MTATSSDVTALCAALDAGDDSALSPFADALEEAGDARAAGLRYAVTGEYRPARLAPEKHGWWRAGAPHPTESYTDGHSVLFRGDYDRLKGGEASEVLCFRLYPSRSAAYLAAAEALAD